MSYDNPPLGTVNSLDDLFDDISYYPMVPTPGGGSHVAMPKGYCFIGGDGCINYAGHFRCGKPKPEVTAASAPYGQNYEVIRLREGPQQVFARDNYYCGSPLVAVIRGEAA